MELVQLEDGRYSGYMVDGKRNGPGTWVNMDFSERLSGNWSNDHFCIGHGLKEFSDGER